MIQKILPIDLLINIFLYLDDESYQNLSLTCRKMLFIGTSEECLNKKFIAYFEKNIYLDDNNFLKKQYINI